MIMPALEESFLAISACPACRAFLSAVSSGGLICNNCQRTYPLTDGIWRFLLPDQTQRNVLFLEVYRRLRQGDGWERRDDSYYLNLPDVPPGDTQAQIWRLRRRTLAIMKRTVLDTLDHQSARWALDLGAGNCWLSHHLALAGYQVLALDVNVEGQDGLSGGEVFLRSGGSSFLRAQASTDILPVRDGQIDVAIISAAFHYVDPQATLKSVYNALKPGGCLVIMDSPVYSKRDSGLLMMQEQLSRLKTQYGIDQIPVAGEGFLVLDDILAMLTSCGFRAEVHWPDNPIRYRLRTILKPTPRENARFPVLVATRLPT